MPSRLRRSSSRPAQRERRDSNRESTASDEAIASFLAEFERQRAERLFRTGTEQERRVAENLLRATGTSDDFLATENDAAIAAIVAGSTEDSVAFSGATLRTPRLEQQQQPPTSLAPSDRRPEQGSGLEATATAANTVEAAPRGARRQTSTTVTTPPTADSVAPSALSSGLQVHLWGRLVRAGQRPSTAPAAVDHCADDAAIAAALAEAAGDQASLPSSARTAPSHPESSPTGRQETCITCLDQVADACFIPCGHINVCCRCAARVNPRKCPVCRMNFEHFVRTQRR